MATDNNNFSESEDILEMKNENLSKKPLVEQIYDELFTNIEKHNAFDIETINTLRQMAAKDELKKSGKVTEAIKVPVKEKNETAGTGN